MNNVADWGTTLWNTMVTSVGMMLAFVPKIIGFVVILLIGWLIAMALQKAVTFLLSKAGFERWADRALGSMEKSLGVSLDITNLLGKVVFWFIFLMFLVPAVQVLGLDSMTTIVQQVIAYIPNIFVAIVVLFAGAVVASLTSDFVMKIMQNNKLGNPRVIASIVRYGILGFAGLVALIQLQIAPSLINILFTGIVAALAIAFGLAFGLGGRDAAQRALDTGEKQMNAMKNHQDRPANTD